MAPRTKLGMAKVEIASLDIQIAKLQRLRDAWSVIAAAEDINYEDAPAASNLTARGEKTAEMRRLLVQLNGSGITRAAIIDKAKDLGAAANFPYKFIDRMIQTGELTEKDDRLFATQKMRDKIARKQAPNLLDALVMQQEPV